MNKLHKESYGGVKGWQWEDGPVFLGVDGRRWATEYGEAVKRLEELTKLAKLHHKRILGEERLETLDLQQGIIEDVKRRFRFHWLDGKIDVSLGKTASEAFTRLGYGPGALPALDYHEVVK